MLPIVQNKMPTGVVFLVHIPTSRYEHALLLGTASTYEKKGTKNNIDLRIKKVKERPELLSVIKPNSALRKDIIKVSSAEKTTNLIDVHKDKNTLINTNLDEDIFLSMETVILILL